VPEAIAPSILVRSRPSNTPNSVFCRSIGQREEPIEKGGDRRQVLAQAAVAIGQPEAGRVLER